MNKENDLHLGGCYHLGLAYVLGYSINGELELGAELFTNFDTGSSGGAMAALTKHRRHFDPSRNIKRFIVALKPVKIIVDEEEDENNELDNNVGCDSCGVEGRIMQSFGEDDLFCQDCIDDATCDNCHELFYECICDDDNSNAPCEDRLDSLEDCLCDEPDGCEEECCSNCDGYRDPRLDSGDCRETCYHTCPNCSCPDYEEDDTCDECREGDCEDDSQEEEQHDASKDIEVGDFVFCNGDGIAIFPVESVDSQSKTAYLGPAVHDIGTGGNESLRSLTLVQDSEHANHFPEFCGPRDDNCLLCDQLTEDCTCDDEDEFCEEFVVDTFEPTNAFARARWIKAQRKTQ